MKSKPEQVVTFKADAALLEAMKGVSNRSRFIRDAILAALDGVCPLCMGTGILSAAQRQHWVGLAETHPIRECPECHERHLTCAQASPAGPAGSPAGGEG